MVQNDKHSLHSTFRERIIEHLFIGELLKFFWNSNRFDIEVLRPEFDREGYDIAITAGKISRFVQFKTSLNSGKASDIKVSLGLINKPNPCVIWIVVDDNLNLINFRWFGAAPSEIFPDVTSLKVAKHAKGNASGIKAERPNHRLLPKSRFESLSSIEEVITKLFG